MDLVPSSDLLKMMFLHKSSAKLHIPELRTTLAVKKRHCAHKMHKIYIKTNESITFMNNKGGAAAEGRRPPLSFIFVIDSFVFMYILCILCVILVHNVVFSQPV